MIFYLFMLLSIPLGHIKIHFIPYTKLFHDFVETERLALAHLIYNIYFFSQMKEDENRLIIKTSAPQGH